jgi:hypothetical protein
MAKVQVTTRIEEKTAETFRHSAKKFNRSLNQEISYRLNQIAENLRRESQQGAPK